MDETPGTGESPAALALRLAHAKAAAVAARHPEALVLGSDQVAELAGLPLGKPGDAAGCRAQLSASSGRTVTFHTAAVLLRGTPALAHAHVDCTLVRFRELSPARIAEYVQRDQPYDCAGGFRAEGLGSALFESVETRDPSALIGLPLIWVAAVLAGCGLDPLSPGDWSRGAAR